DLSVDRGWWGRRAGTFTAEGASFKVKRKHDVKRARCTSAPCLAFHPVSGSTKSQPACSNVLHNWARRTTTLVQRPLLRNFSDQLSRSRVKTRLLLFFG